MRKSRSTDKAIESAQPIQVLTLRQEKDHEVPSESDLSPDRVMDGASNTAVLLHQILAQREAFHQLRDWGINE